MSLRLPDIRYREEEMLREIIKNMSCHQIREHRYEEDTEPSVVGSPARPYPKQSWT